jgi:hypothetical protein
MKASMPSSPRVTVAELSLPPELHRAKQTRNQTRCRTNKQWDSPLSPSKNHFKSITVPVWSFRTPSFMEAVSSGYFMHILGIGLSSRLVKNSDIETHSSRCFYSMHCNQAPCPVEELFSISDFSCTLSISLTCFNTYVTRLYPRRCIA